CFRNSALQSHVLSVYFPLWKIRSDIPLKVLPLLHPQSRSAGKSPGNCHNHLLHSPLEIEKASVPCPSCSPLSFLCLFGPSSFARRFCLRYYCICFQSNIFI